MLQASLLADEAQPDANHCTLSSNIHYSLRFKKRKSLEGNIFSNLTFAVFYKKVMP
jgi:hypothetical protein